MEEIKQKNDLEDRTFKFAKDVRYFVKQLKRNAISIEDIKQLVRSSGSVGANYIEANESMSRKDFVYRVKISRKEAKESIFWLRLIDTDDNPILNDRRLYLVQECTELMNIFGSIYQKCKDFV